MLWSILKQNFTKNLITTIRPSLITAVEGGIKKGVETGTIKTGIPDIDTFYKAMTQCDKHWQVNKIDIDPETLPIKQH